MYLKTHLSGDYIAYDLAGKGGRNALNPPPPGRYQGSLINQQKRKIADACEYLRLSTKGHKERAAIIFILTSPGYRAEANNPKFVSRFFDNARSNYGLGEYVWVRETSAQGMVHFHCVADWWGVNWFFDDASRCRDGILSNRAVDLARYWSSLFGHDSKNTFRLGGYWFGKRIYTLRTQRQARYLCKYLGKQFSNQKKEPAPIGLESFVEPVKFRGLLPVRSSGRQSSFL